jgi:hypothetical protein
MLKRTIKYTNFNDVQTEGVFYFNLSKAELIQMEVSTKEGFGEMLQRIVETKDNKALIDEFKKIILLAYGERSPDGERFVKSDELREAFSHTAAFQELFLELALETDAAAAFITGIVPKDMGASLQRQINGSPTPPPPPTPL